MVIYQETNGQQGHHEIDDLDAAIKFVEDLRNSKGVERSRLVQLETLNFEFKPYYRVEIGGTAVTRPMPAPIAEPVVERAPFAEPPKVDRPPFDPQPAVWGEGVATDPAMPAEPVFDGEEVGANVRRGLFGR
jgi:hypothetical protein